MLKTNEEDVKHIANIKRSMVIGKEKLLLIKMHKYNNIKDG